MLDRSNVQRKEQAAVGRCLAVAEAVVRKKKEALGCRGASCRPNGPTKERAAVDQHLGAAVVRKKKEALGPRGASCRPSGPTKERAAVDQHLGAAVVRKKKEALGPRGASCRPSGPTKERAAVDQHLRAAVVRKKKEALGPRGASCRPSGPTKERAAVDQHLGAAGRPEEEGSTRAQRRELQAERADEGAGGRGPTPGRGGRPEEEGSSRVQRRELQAERADAGVGGRGPRPIATEAEQRGYPFADEDVLNPEQVQARYLAFTRSWGRFGLSRLCEACYTLTPAKHCRKSTGAEKMLCRNCREKNTKFLLPVLPAIPEALRQLQPIEQHLIAMARISQVLLDKLPAGGPSAQWGRMYAVLVDEPYICDVLEGATLEEDGTVLVEGVQGQIASPARLDRLFKALQELKAQHRLYKANPAVGVALADMEAILARTGTRPSSSAIACADHVSSQGRQTGESGGSHSSALGCSEQTPGKTEEPQAAGKKQEGVLEITYLMPKELKAPRPQKADLQKARSIAELSDDMDVKVFPHLFPTGTGGWQNGYGSLSQYARKRLLGLDPRFQASPAYIMWLLEMHIKKRLSGNINVRISGQTPNAKSKYQEGRGHVFTALRDIPGTSSYVFAKKGVALNMYEQLGTPKFFMTLSCHARQPDILIAVIMARLLQLHPEKPPQELEREAAQILQCYQADRKFTWDGLSPNQLCNQYPAVVTRQFMHQLTQLMHWLSAGQGAASRMEEDADAQDEPEDALEQDFLQAPAADSAGRHRGVRKEDPPFRVVDYVIRIEWQKRGYPHAHILLWVVEWENKEKPDDKTKSTAEDKDVEAEAQVPDWSDDESDEAFHSHPRRGLERQVHHHQRSLQLAPIHESLGSRQRAQRTAGGIISAQTHRILRHQDPRRLPLWLSAPAGTPHPAPQLPRKVRQQPLEEQPRHKASRVRQRHGPVQHQDPAAVAGQHGPAGDLRADQRQPLHSGLCVEVGAGPGGAAARGKHSCQPHLQHCCGH